MSGPQAPFQKFDYEGFEIHVSSTPVAEGSDRYTYAAYVCHPGADPSMPGHTVSFRANGDETFRSAQDATEEAVSVGQSVIDGSHPDLSVLSLVTHGF
ncbi:MAG TPA: hypothetical protein VL689_13250 [Paraburkholderia sp.]|nr:hypothetical protein [Paraburkholderia sp.]